MSTTKQKPKGYERKNKMNKMEKHLQLLEDFKGIINRSLMFDRPIFYNFTEALEILDETINLIKSIETLEISRIVPNYMTFMEKEEYLKTDVVIDFAKCLTKNNIIKFNHVGFNSNTGEDKYVATLTVLKGDK